MKRKTIVVKDDNEDENLLSGKGPKSLGKLLGSEEIKISKAKNLDYSKYSVVFFYFNEDLSKNIQKFIDLSKFIKEKFPKITIFNDPSFCDIGDKYETLKYIQENGGIPNIKVPPFWKICKEEDCQQVEEFPAILKIPKGSNLKGEERDIIANNQEELKREFQKKKEISSYFLCVKFIKSKHPKNIFCSIRFHFIDSKLIEIMPRPSQKWNVHVSDQNQSLVKEYDKKFKDWLKKNMNFNETIKKINKLFGPGSYAMDCVWDGEKLYFAEIGYKIYNKGYVNFIKKNNIKIDKKHSEGLERILEEIKEELEEKGVLNKKPVPLEKIPESKLYRSGIKYRIKKSIKIIGKEGILKGSALIGKKALTSKN